jgi:hypothetical protein
MTMMPYNKTRPMAVNFALIVLALDNSVAFVVDVSNFQLSHYVMFWIWLVEDIFLFVLLWCAFRGKNWARWFVAIWMVLEVCISPFSWVSFHQPSSILWAIWFWSSWLLDVIAVLALFHASSNLWFRGSKMPPSQSPEPTPIEDSSLNH